LLLAFQTAASLGEDGLGRHRGEVVVMMRHEW
jgi:hypothetical protein